MLLNNPIDKYQLIARTHAHLQGCKLATKQSSVPAQPKRRPEGLGKIIVLGAFQAPTQLLLSCHFLF